MYELAKCPEYVSISTMSKMLNIAPTVIVTDFKTYKINKFLIENQNEKAKYAANKRITRLIDRLNEYACNNINKSPYHLFTNTIKNEITLNVERQQYLNSKIYSDNIFELWLAEYGFCIDNFKLVIPVDEVLKYKEYINNKSMSNSISDNIDKKAMITRYEQARDELLKAGLDAGNIAKELKKTFPSISKSRIGKLLPFNPDKVVTQDAHRKRGEKLLGI